MKCLLTLLLLTVGSVHAADKRGATANKRGASILVEPDQLQKQLNDKNLRVLDVRSQNEYAKGHIPGAPRVEVGDWKNLATADSGLRDAKGWTEKVSPLGLKKEMHVVVYGSKLSDTARIWWLLKYVGVKNASILNGGWVWWMKEERPGAEKPSPTSAGRHRVPDPV